MYKKFIAGLLTVVCCVSAKSNFIGNKRARAKLFELTDNEVAVFRVTLPDEEFAQLKEEANMSFGGFGDFNFTDFNFTWPDFGDFNNTEGGLPPFPGFGGDENGEGGFPPFPEFGEGSFEFPSFGGGIFGDEDSFKTKNGTLVVELNGESKNFKKLTFSLGGSSSRMFGKQGYNIKIRGNKDLYGRTQFRLRPDAREATYLRSKLVCDIHNRLGLPSISANYATLYINDEYMGFYVLMDAIKLSWIEFEYGDVNSTHLYKCKDVNNMLTVKSSSKGCVNENEEVTDNSEWIEFLTRLDAAQSAEDIEDIFDIDLFLTELAFEYLSGSWDHYLNFGHNFNLYKPKDDKWKFMIYDFDGELGQDAAMGAAGFGFGFGERNPNTDYPTYSFEEWAQPRHLIDILILNDPTRFNYILKNFVTEVFNPATLFPHIDELKEFIRPYVELDKTPDENGKYPGRINESATDYSLAEWEANSEFTTVASAQWGIAYGLKYWILAKYRYVCKTYEMECDETYLDENYQFPIDKEVEVDPNNNNPFINFPGPGGQGALGAPDASDAPVQENPGGFPVGGFPGGNIPGGNMQGGFPGGGFPGGNMPGGPQQPPVQPTEIVDVPKPTETDDLEPTEITIYETTETVVPQPSEIIVPQLTETVAPQPTEIIVPQPTETEDLEPTEITIYESTETVVVPQPTEIVPQPTEIVVPQPTEPVLHDYKCWSELIGYPCCSPNNKKVYAQDEYGDWGYNFAKNEWCGITPYSEPINDNECWSEIFGYSCCKDCTVYEIDEYGEWGYNFAKNEWCGIQSFCKA